MKRDNFLGTFLFLVVSQKDSTYKIRAKTSTRKVPNIQQYSIIVMLQYCKNVNVKYNETRLFSLFKKKILILQHEIDKYSER